jgi:hypothetical protein
VVDARWREAWSDITSGPGATRVVDLASSGGYVYVVTEQASTCPGQLWRSANATDTLQSVATVNLAPEEGDAGSILAIHDTTGYLVTAATTGPRNSGTVGHRERDDVVARTQSVSRPVG